MRNLLLLTLVTATAAQAAPLARFEVQAGKWERTDTPVCAEVGTVALDKPVCLEEVRGGARTPVPCQVEPGKPARLWWILSGTTAAGASRVFELVEGAPAPAPNVEVRTEKEYLEIACAGTKVLRFNTVLMAPPPGVAPKFSRSGYIHPAWTPAGLGVTDDFPADHRHQHGIWMAWTKTEFEGRHPDFWNIGTASATVRLTKVESTVSGPVFGGFRAHLEWVDLAAPGGEKVVLNEVLDVRVWRVGGPEKGYFLWDFTSTQRCASASPLNFPQYYYGGMGFRGAAEWLKEVRFLTSEGKGRTDGDNSPARWIALDGPIGERKAGTILMTHPANFRHPEPLRLNPKQPQICVAPSQQGPWTMEPGKEYTWRYRFCIRDGESDAALADRLWRDFGEVPAVVPAAK